MGQKVHPIGFRVGITRDWDSTWFSDREYHRLVHEDILIRDYVRSKYAHAGISKINIRRVANNTKVHIYSAKPNIIIGKRSIEQGPGQRKSSRELIQDKLSQLTGTQVEVNALEARKAEMDAQLVSENISAQLVKRVSFRRAMKKAVGQVQRAGAKGVKIMCSGRLGGAEMSRTEWYHEGRVPLHTLRADVDYGFSEAMTTYGVIGVKVWIFKGEKLPGQDRS